MIKRFISGGLLLVFCVSFHHIDGAQRAAASKFVPRTLKGLQYTTAAALGYYYGTGENAARSRKLDRDHVILSEQTLLTHEKLGIKTPDHLKVQPYSHADHPWWQKGWQKARGFFDQSSYAPTKPLFEQKPVGATQNSYFSGWFSRPPEPKPAPQKQNTSWWSSWF